jgi:hypothetical protein
MGVGIIGGWFIFEEPPLPPQALRKKVIVSAIKKRLNIKTSTLLSITLY